MKGDLSIHLFWQKYFLEKGYFLLIILLLLGTNLPAKAQSILNDKRYYDSLILGKITGNFSVQGSFNYDGTEALLVNNNGLLSVPTRKHLIELSESFFINSFDRANAGNRLNVFARMAFFRHQLQPGKKSMELEKNWFPEMVAVFFYDEGRGLNFRGQLGVNGTYNGIHTRTMRLKIGAGLVVERESWRILSRDFLPALDTLPPSLLSFIQEKFQINSRGNIVKNNIRANVYAQLLVDITEKLNVNLISSIQHPLARPYKAITQLPEFPVLDKLFPRVTVDLAVKYFIAKRLYVLGKVYLQLDEGQISPFAKERVYNISQGVGVEF